LKTFSMTLPDHEERSFGSPYDPLLNGVAQGLATLFPPIDNARRPESQDGADRANEVEDERPGE
jgi:hypothetical protein